MRIHRIIPNVSVGDVLFSSTEEGVLALGYRHEENSTGLDTGLGWKKYTKNDGLECYLKDGKVACLACFASCYWGEVDLIGKTPDELISILGQPDEVGDQLWVDEDRQQTPFEYFSYGLQVWVESDKVVSLFCDAVEDDR